jgi:hypothetical protein
MGKFWDHVTFPDGISVHVLRLFDIGMILGVRFWDLSTLTTLEIHDCTDVDKVLLEVVKSTTSLTRLVVADSGYKKQKKGVKAQKGNPSTINGKRLFDILRKNPTIKHLCIYMGVITERTAAEIIAVLPRGLENHVMVQTTSDFFSPQDYRALGRQSSGLLGLGTAMHFAAEDERFRTIMV